jgi:hypothetical protein
MRPLRCTRRSGSAVIGSEEDRAADCRRPKCKRRSEERQPPDPLHTGQILVMDFIMFGIPMVGCIFSYLSFWPEHRGTLRRSTEESLTDEVRDQNRL